MPKKKTTGETPDLQLLDASKTFLPEGNKVALSRAGLTFTDDLLYEEWQTVVLGLKTVHNRYRAMLGDCLHYGMRQYGGEKVESTCEQLELDLTDVAHAMFIGEIPAQHRDEFSSLNNEHFYVVGRYVEGTDAQEHWLTIAVKERLSSVELRESIDRGEVVKSHATDKTFGRNSGNILTIQAISHTFILWRKQVGNTLDKWTFKEKKEFLDQTEEIAILREEVIDSLEE